MTLFLVWNGLQILSVNQDSESEVLRHALFFCRKEGVPYSEIESDVLCSFHILLDSFVLGLGKF